MSSSARSQAQGDNCRRDVIYMYTRLVPIRPRIAEAAHKEEEDCSLAAGGHLLLVVVAGERTSTPQPPASVVWVRAGSGSVGSGQTGGRICLPYRLWSAPRIMPRR